MLGIVCGLDARPHPEGASAHDLGLLADIATLARGWLDREADAQRLRLRHARLERRLLDKAALAAAPGAAARGIIIGVVQNPAPALRGDRALLGEMLSRLLAHATRVSTPADRVMLGADFDPAQGFRFWVENGGQAKGPPAFQFPGAPGLLSRPTGLGLPLARALVEAHGGHITAEALEGGRQRLLVRLPASRALPEQTGSD